MVCRQLGFPGAALARAQSPYGGVVGIPLARDRECQGGEKSKPIKLKETLLIIIIIIKNNTRIATLERLSHKLLHRIYPSLFPLYNFYFRE